MLTGTVTSLTPIAADAGSLGADLGTLAFVLLASIASGAVAFPVARYFRVPRIFRRFRRSDPQFAAATLIACASIAHKRSFNVEASATPDPLIARAVSLAASDTAVDDVMRELATDPPAAPRPTFAWAPVLGLAIALTGLGVVVSAVSYGLVAGTAVGIALVAALYGAFFLSTACGACDDRAGRLDPRDVLTRAVIAAAVPAIRAGADSTAVEQLLRPLLNPDTTETRAGRKAA